MTASASLKGEARLAATSGGRLGRLSSVVDRHRRVLLAIIVLFGAGLRTRGLSNGTWFRDDSWVAISVRMSARSAWSLACTSPGALYAFRLWVGIAPGSLLWAQLPSFVAGTMGIFAVYWLVRRFGFPAWIALVCALVLASAVIPAVYATHLKPYVFDLLWTCLLLALAETARRADLCRPALQYAGVAIIATWWSLSIAPVVIAGALLIVGSLRSAGRRRRVIVVSAMGLVACSLVLERSVLARGLPRLLGDYFTKYYLRAWPPSSVASSWTAAGGRILSALTIGRGGQPPIVLGCVVVAVLICLCVLAWNRARVAVVAIGVLMVSSLLQLSPIGGQRSDIFFLPVYLLLVAAGLAALDRSLVDRPRARGVGVAIVGVTCMALVAASVVSIGARVHQWSDGDFRAAHAQVERLMVPGTLVVAPGFVAEEWAYYVFTPPVAIVRTQQLATGFRLRSRPGVFFDSRVSRIRARDLPATLRRVIDLQFSNLHEERSTASVLHHWGYVRVASYARGGYSIYVWEHGHALPAG